MLVRDVMTREVQSIRMDRKLLAARTSMELKHIRHIPVVNEHGDLVGLLTRGAILAAATSSLEHVPRAQADLALGRASVADAMVHDPITIASDAHIHTAAHLMVTRKIGCLPVVDNGKLVGILSEIDLLRLVEIADASEWGQGRGTPPGAHQAPAGAHGPTKGLRPVA